METVMKTTFLPVVDGRVKLCSDTLASAIWQQWLGDYHAGEPLELTEAQRE